MDNGLIIAIGALLVMLAGIVYAIRRGVNPDQAATLELQRIQANREAMERYERLYADQQATTRQMIDAFAGIVRVIAPLTPIMSDDELARWLDDIRTPGDHAARTALTAMHESTSDEPKA